LLDEVICFLFNGQSTPLFLNRNSVYISELEANPKYLNVSIIVDNHEWLKAQITPDDFKKYQKWKDR
jgi:hypothetical protein